jgi:hypothetical protein
MPGYERKNIPFFIRGMNLNRPVDQLGEGEYALLENVRSYVAGRIEGRSPLALVTDSFVSASNNYVHSIATISDLDPDGAPSPASARFFGYLNELWCSASGAGMQAATKNSGWGTSGSGLPMSMIVASPVGAPVPWMYVYDSTLQRKFSTRYGALNPYAFPIGLSMLWSAHGYLQWFIPQPTSINAGSLTGLYYYRYQVRDPYTGVVGQAEPPSGYPASALGSASIFGHLTLSSQQVTFTPPTIAHPAGGYYLLDAYRYGGAVNDWHLVKTVPADGTTWTDTESDTVALNAPLLDNTRFQPWVSQDIPRTISCTIVAGVAGTGLGDGHGSRMTRTGGDYWNPNWLPGTRLIVNDDIACTLHRFCDNTNPAAAVIEVVEDLGALGASTVKVTGALESGAPMPRAWGPYGAGQSGVTYFACGDPQRPGTLVWTTGNDPDSTSPTYSLEVTDPSDPLQNGCMYNGRAYVFSARSMYEIIPDSSAPGQFLTQVIPGSKGLWAPWALVVGDVIYFAGKDGLYETTGAGAPVSITDASLYPLFEHENVPGQTISIANPDNFAAPLLIYPPNPALVHTWRLTYGDSTLYFDYEDTGDMGAGVSPAPRAFVYCKLPQPNGSTVRGWVYDHYSGSPGYVNRYFEVVPSATSPTGGMLLAMGKTIYAWAGGSAGDNGAPISCRVQSGALDLGDNRALKLVGDQMVDANCNGLAVRARILGNNNTSEISSSGPALTAAAPRTQNIIDINGGLGTLSRTVGLWLSWSQSTSAIPEFYQWSPSYVVKPPLVKYQATDWSNDGKPCAKYLMGCVIEADIETQTFYDLQVDALSNRTVSSVNVNGGTGFQSWDLDGVVSVTVPVLGWVAGLYRIQAVAGGKAILDRSPAPVGTATGSFTFSRTYGAAVEYDGGVMGPGITMSHPGQTELPYSFTPVVCHEMRLRLTGSFTSGIRIFGVTWLWIEYPEYLALAPDYAVEKWPSGKYVRGVVLEGDTQGAAVPVSFQYDGATHSTTTITQPGKTMTAVGFLTPFLAHEVRVVPLGNWRRHSVRWIYDDYPDFATLLTPWIDFGGKEDKLLRGVLIKADTAAGSVTVTLHADGAVTGYSWVITADGQRQIPVALNPPLPITLARLAPSGPWRFFEVEWLFDEYPSLAPIFTPWNISTKPRYFRAVNLRADTDNLPVSVEVQKDGAVPQQTLPGLQLNGQGVQTFPLTPFVAYAVRLKPSAPWRFFDADWAADEYPDLDARVSPIVTLKPIGAKLMQGIRLTADTGAVPVQFRVLYDGGQVGDTFPATFNGKLTLPFSFPTPFIAHNLQIQPLGHARVFLGETEWVWEPAPELTEHWETPMMTHGVEGWWSHVDLLLAHNSTASLAVSIVTDDGVVYTTVIASSGGVYKRDYLRLPPRKCKAARYIVYSNSKFRLYVQDCRLTIAAWGRSGQSELRPVKPFGDLSVVDGARI